MRARATRLDQIDLEAGLPRRRPPSFRQRGWQRRSADLSRHRRALNRGVADCRAGVRRARTGPRRGPGHGLHRCRLHDRLRSTHEYVLLGRTGLSFRQILTALATEPVSRSGGSVHSSRVAAGVDAELVVPDGDPAVRSPHWPASGMSYSKAGSSTTGRFQEDVAGRRLPIPRAVLSRLSRVSVQELDG